MSDGSGSTSDIKRADEGMASLEWEVLIGQLLVTWPVALAAVVVVVIVVWRGHFLIGGVGTLSVGG